MTLQQVETRCRDNADELINKHFCNLIEEAAVEMPEEIGDYGLEMPRQIEAEYHACLEELWLEIASQDPPSFEEIMNKKHLSDRMKDDDREIIRPAYDAAVRQTLWERISKTNHKDVVFYKGLLKRYTEELLQALRCDYLEDVRITTM